MGEGYASWLNPDSTLYNDFFSVFASSFIITFTLMLQPHILTKVLYIKDPKQLSRFLVTTVVTGVVFSLILFVGFYARLRGLEVPRQDLAVITYVSETFNPYVVAFVLITLLAAGMSILDGILVSISTVVVVDIGLAFGERTEARVAQGLKWSRFVLVAIGLIALALAWDPPALLGIFAQQGLYGLVAASAAPLILGILRPQLQQPFLIGALAAIGVGTHFLLHLAAGVVNPSVSASVGILISCGLGLAWSLWPAVNRQPTASSPSGSKEEMIESIT